MATRVARLTDGGNAPFFFKMGDKVALAQRDGTPDPDPRSQGVISDGECQYEEGGGTRQATYAVKRADGIEFSAIESSLVRLPD